MSSSKLGRNPFQAGKPAAAPEPVSAESVKTTAPSESRAPRAMRLEPAGSLAHSVEAMHPWLKWALVDVAAETYVRALKAALIARDLISRSK